MTRMHQLEALTGKLGDVFSAAVLVILPIAVVYGIVSSL